VRPTDTYEYGDEKFQEFDPKPNIYYIPKMANEEALDSFILHKNFLYIFQFTVSKKHDIKTGFIARFTACDKFPPPKNWHFIFIIGYNDDQIFKSPYPQIRKIPGFKPFSAQVAMEGYAELTESTKSHPKRSIEEGEVRECPEKKKLRSAEGSNNGGTSKQKGKGKGKQRQK